MLLILSPLLKKFPPANFRRFVLRSETGKHPRGCGLKWCAPQKLRTVASSSRREGGSGVRSWTFMCLLDGWLKALRHLIRTGFRVLLDFLGPVGFTCRSRSAVEAENLFLRKQLALFLERKTKPRRAAASSRRLIRIPVPIRVKTAAPNSKNQPQYCAGCETCGRSDGRTDPPERLSPRIERHDLRPQRRCRCPGDIPTRRPRRRPGSSGTETESPWWRPSPGAPPLKHTQERRYSCVSEFAIQIRLPGLAREPEGDICANRRSNRSGGSVLVPRVATRRNENGQQDIGAAKRRDRRAIEDREKEQHGRAEVAEHRKE